MAVGAARPERHVEGVVGLGIDDEPQRCAEAAAPRHHLPARPHRRPLVPFTDQDDGRNANRRAFGTRRIIGDGGRELAIEQPLRSVESHGGERDAAAKRVADKGDAVGIDERQGREMQQRAVGVHDHVDRCAASGAAIGDAARTETVDGEQHVAECGVAGGVGLFEAWRQAAAAGVEQDDRREGAVTRRAIEFAGKLDAGLLGDGLAGGFCEPLLQRRRRPGGAAETNRLRSGRR